MIIENSLNPNCSEAVLRIKVENMDKKEKEKMIKELQKAVKKYDYETYVETNKIFDTDLVVVYGDMPYNNPDPLGKIADKYNREFELATTEG